MNKKILIFHTSVGLGHKYIAQNIGWHLAQAGFEVKLADIGQVQSGNFGKIITKIHQFINKHLPFIWGFLYRYGHYPILPFRVLIASFNYEKAKTFIDDFNPDLVISVHTTASAIVAYLKRKGLYKNKFAIGFSDYHLHPYWLYKEADFYLANIEEQKQQMVNKGFNPATIFVCGITLKPKINVNAADIRSKLGIKETERVVLIGTGSLGIGFKPADLQELLSFENIKIIFACGKNIALFNELKNLNQPNIIPLSFYEPMAELYAIANIFVGKPGGLSTAESLQWILPLIVTFTLPGQEELNVDYLEPRKLILVNKGNLVQLVKQELESGAFKKQLQTNPSVPTIIDQARVGIQAVKKYIF